MPFLLYKNRSRANMIRKEKTAVFFTLKTPEMTENFALWSTWTA